MVESSNEIPVRAPLKVAYLTTKFPLLSETFIYQELLALADAGHDVRFSAFFATGQQGHGFATDLDRSIEFLPKILSLRHALDHLASWANPLYWQELFGLVRECRSRPVRLAKSLYAFCKGVSWFQRLRKDPPDHLHAHWATAPTTAAMVAARLLDRPFSFTAHAWDIYKEPILLETKIRRAQAVFTISNYNQVYLERLNANADGRISVIRCGIEVERFPFHPPASRDGRPLRILSVARLVPKKGLHHLIEACRILESSGIAFECKVVGDGPQKARLARAALRAGLKSNIHFVGAMTQEELDEVWEWADVFALPCVVSADGNRDGIPVALMEAMASGLPVVSTRVSGIPELISHRRNGLLVEPGSAIALAQAIREIGNDLRLAQRLAKQARKTIEAEYSADRNALAKAASFAGMTESPREEVLRAS